MKTKNAKRVHICPDADLQKHHATHALVIFQLLISEEITRKCLREKEENCQYHITAEPVGQKASIAYI